MPEEARLFRRVEVAASCLIRKTLTPCEFLDRFLRQQLFLALFVPLVSWCFSSFVYIYYTYLLAHVTREKSWGQKIYGARIFLETWGAFVYSSLLYFSLVKSATRLLSGGIFLRIGALLLYYAKILQEFVIFLSSN